MLKEYPDSNFYYFTTKSDKVYTKVNFKKGDFLVFGRETKGLPEDFLHAHWDNAVTIPMKEGQRSLNLSNSVAIVLYEALRQQNFANLKQKGALTKFEW